ncbi:MAG: dockerin type I domain-containing protein [Pseudomonadota bacterium]
MLLVLATLGVAVACGGRSTEVGLANSSGGTGNGGSLPAVGGRAAAGREDGGARAGASSGEVAAGAPQLLGGAAGSAGCPTPSDAGAPDAGAGGVANRIVGDINDDGCVNLKDYAILARCFGYPTNRCAEPEADVQRDGWVDELDWLLMSEHWFQGPQCAPWCQSIDDGAAGAAGAPTRGSPDLNGDGCVNFDDLDRLAESYGCGPECAGPGSDLVPDGCVDDQDEKFLAQSFDQEGHCVQLP